MSRRRVLIPPDCEGICPGDWMRLWFEESGAEGVRSRGREESTAPVSRTSLGSFGITWLASFGTGALGSFGTGTCTGESAQCHLVFSLGLFLRRGKAERLGQMARGADGRIRLGNLHWPTAFMNRCQ